MSDTLQTHETQTHVRLMTRMARTTASDLDSLTDDAWAGALKRCCGCAKPGSCHDWLEDNAQGASAPPSYCANAALMTGPSA